MADTEDSLFLRLVELIRTLRRECPWDRAQTVESLAPLLLDECYEVKEAVKAGDPDGLREELGDVLAVALMMAEIASQAGEFNLNQALEGIVQKLERRHPHVLQGKPVENAREVVEKWSEIKTAEKKDSILKGIPKGLPALRRAYLIQQRASAVGFDWEDLEGPLQKLEEEIDELRRAKSKEETEDELGDVLFILVNLGNKLGVDPEEALSGVCDKFVHRFSKVEETLRKQGKEPKDVSLEEMDEIWERVKGEDGD